MINTYMILERIAKILKMVITLMKIIYLIFEIYITISYFSGMLAVIQKKTEVDSENNGQSRMVTVSTNWLS